MIVLPSLVFAMKRERERVVFCTAGKGYISNVNVLILDSMLEMDHLFHYDLTLYICHIINSLEFMPPCTRFVTPQYKVEY